MSFPPFAARRNLIGEVVLLNPAQNRGFQSAEAEIEFVTFHASQGKFHGARVAGRRKAVEHRAAGIAEA